MEDKDASQQKTNLTVTGTIHIFVEDYQTRMDAPVPVTFTIPASAPKVEAKTSAVKGTASITTASLTFPQMPGRLYLRMEAGVEAAG